MIRLLIADDHKIVADGLASILAQESDIQILGQASNGRKVIDCVENEACDVLLLDVNMPEMNGEEVAVQLKEEHPDIRILVMSMHDNGLQIEKMIKAGVNGYVLKNIAQMELIQAIRTVAQGEEYFSPEVTKKMIARMRRQSEKSTRLTERELDVLKLMGEGKQTAQIAEQLFISPHTVRTHKKSLLSKSAMSNALELVRWGRENELIV